MKTVLACLRSPSLLGLAVLLLSGCAGTKVVRTWTAPDFVHEPFTKIFVLVLAENDFNRRLAENAVVAQISHVPNVASFQVLPDMADTRVKAKLLQAIKESKSDGLVVLRMVYTETGVNYGKSSVVPMDYQTFSGYYGATYDVSAYYAQERRKVYTDRVFGIETSIYDVKTEKLIWMALTRSTRDMTNDHNVIGLATEVAKTVKAELRSQNLTK